MLKEYDLVKTLVEKDGFPAGTKGVVVDVQLGGEGAEVELWGPDKSPAAVVGYYDSELEVLDSN